MYRACEKLRRGFWLNDCQGNLWHRGNVSSSSSWQRTSPQLNQTPTQMDSIMILLIIIKPWIRPDLKSAGELRQDNGHMSEHFIAQCWEGNNAKVNGTRATGQFGFSIMQHLSDCVNYKYELHAEISYYPLVTTASRHANSPGLVGTVPKMYPYPQSRMGHTRDAKCPGIREQSHRSIFRSRPTVCKPSYLHQWRGTCETGLVS
jgi:hypothetical protein